MPRLPRVFVPGGVYHVWSHGSDRRPLFVFDADREAFLKRLSSVVKEFELGCVAWCLMSNHYHVVIQTPDARLSRALQHLHGGYSRQFNRLYGRRAHLFRNRFGSRLVDGERDLLGTCRYLAYNPIEAGLCGAPSEWPWSSFGASAGLAPVPPLLEERLLREAFGDDPGWRARYRDFVEQPSEDDF
jgi:REP element-mobilizing transposase RayT